MKIRVGATSQNPLGNERFFGAANRICKERSDGIAHFAPFDLRAEFTQGASGSPPKGFSVG